MSFLPFFSPSTTSTFFSILHVTGLVILCFASGCFARSTRLGSGSELHEPLMMCNNDTEYKCICRGKLLKRDGSIKDCDQFIQSQELPVVDMRMRHINLEADLHTNEKYETYFKRRIANIVSSYCERQVNECPGTALKLSNAGGPDDSSDDHNDAHLVDEKSVLYAADEYDPLLTQDNVVLLRVEREPGNVTRVLFAITKSIRGGAASLNEQMIIDPIKIKYILGSQSIPLARVLGGIKLDSVRVSRIRRTVPPPEPQNNSKLLMMVYVVGGFFFVCYTIGGIRLYRDCKKRKRDREVEAEALTTVKPNYGSCGGGSDRKPSRNGNTIGNGGLEESPIPSHYQPINESPDSYYREPEPVVLSDRAVRMMFMCDPSQLPREPTFDSETELIDSVHLTPPQKASPPREVVPPIQEEEPSMTISSPTLEPSSISSEFTKDAAPVVLAPPALVFMNSESLHDDTPTSDDSPNAAITAAATLLCKSDESTGERPKSRRGSRVDEEVLDLREIGITQSSPDVGSPEQIASPIAETPEKWSSSEGEVDVYYKLSDDEDIIKADDWTVGDTTVIEGSNVDSESEADDGDDLALHVADQDPENFVYERLREDLSPQPPPQS